MFKYIKENFLFMLYNTEYLRKFPYKYDKEWDEYLKFLMSQYKFKMLNENTVTLGTFTLSIKNHPFESFSFASSKKRPSKKTIYYAGIKLVNDCFDLFGRYDDVYYIKVDAIMYKKFNPIQRLVFARKVAKKYDVKKVKFIDMKNNDLSSEILGEVNV